MVVKTASIVPKCKLFLVLARKQSWSIKKYHDRIEFGKCMTCVICHGMN